MTLASSDLVLCSGTLPGTASIEDRLAAAVAGGFRGLSLWRRDIDRARAVGHTDADIRAMFAHHDIEVAEVDPVWRWLPGSDMNITSDDDASGVLYPSLDELFEIATAFGARSLNACEIISDGSGGIDAAAASFAVLCDRAAEHGLLVQLEFLPWSRFADAATAHDVVALADRPNGGLMLDTWHFFRGSADLDALRAIPGDRLTGVQLNDAPRQPADDLMTESIEARQLPGDGELDLASVIAVLDEIGAVAPIGVEVFSSSLQRLDPIEVGRRAGAAARAVLNGNAVRNRNDETERDT